MHWTNHNRDNIICITLGTDTFIWIHKEEDMEAIVKIVSKEQAVHLIKNHKLCSEGVTYVEPDHLLE